MASNLQGGKFQDDARVLTLPFTDRLDGPVRAVAADFDGDHHPDVLLAGAGGRLLLLHNRGEGRFTPLEVKNRLPEIRRFAAGDLRGRGLAELVWLDSEGGVFRAGISIRAGVATLSRPVRIFRASPDDGLAVGRFHGYRTADVLVGQHLIEGGNPRHIQYVASLPNSVSAREDLAWLAGDFDGDGRDDVLRVRRSTERFTGSDLILYLSTAGKEHPWACSSNDGIPDFWKRGTIKPGGLDLKSLGCVPCHHDVIVEVQPFENVPRAPMLAEISQAVRYYASLPIANADGSHGIALHVIERESIPLTESSLPWWDLGEKHHPAEHRGITHWMMVYNGGGGQSGEMADRGGCGSHALYATFLHEFGHQLGLDHTGHWAPNWCPIYPSLMNYAYNYQLNGRRENIRYSDGALASLILNERHLSERLPIPMDKLSYLAGPPYHYRMKPSPDGKGTWIDWNWNGVYGETDIAADINYGYSTSAGERHTVDRTYCAPALAENGSGSNSRLLLFYGQLAPGASEPPADATAKQPGLSPDQPGSLVARVWQGSDPIHDAEPWSGETVVEAAGVTGDPSAIGQGGATWVAYPTLAGVRIRPLEAEASGGIRVGASMLVPDSAGALPTVTTVNGHLAILLWRSAEKPVGLRFADQPAGGSDSPAFSNESSLGFTAVAPVGAVEGAADNGLPSLWIGLLQDQDKNRTARWQVRRFVVDGPAPPRQVEMEWVGGESGGERGGSRVILLRQPEPALGPQGQLYFLAAGAFGKDSPWACHYVATRVADRSVNGGWLTRRYYDEWTQSRSAPGACFYQGELIFASRWFGNAPAFRDNNLFVAFSGRGIEDQPMGDFDDIGLIRDVGASHSIPYVNN